MPGRVQDLLGKVNRLDIDIILLAVLGPCHHLVLGRSHSLGLERALVCLKSHIVLAIAIVNVKVVVVRSSQHIAIIVIIVVKQREQEDISKCIDEMSRAHMVSVRAHNTNKDDKYTETFYMPITG